MRALAAMLTASYRQRRRSALPAPRLMVPVRTALIPVVGYPVITAALVYVVAAHPNVLVAAPLPEPRCPHKADLGRRNRLNTHRWWRHVDIDGDSGRGDGRCGDRSCSHHQAQ